MRYLFQAAALWAASAIAFPTSLVPPPAAVDAAVAGSTAANTLSVYFSIPCQGCSLDKSEELEIELKIDPSDLSCQSSALVLNDIRFSPMSLPIHFKANTANRPGIQDVIASWKMTCINDDVSLISLHIDEIFGQAQAQQPSGFSASFKQGPSPEFLRLELAPTDVIEDTGALQHWTERDNDPDFVVVSVPTAVNDRVSDEVQEQLRRLHEIKARIGRLHRKYMRQERYVFELIKKDFSTCHGASCIFQTAIKKAPDFFELVKAHFKHRPDWEKLRGHKFGGSIHKQGDSALMYGNPESFHDGIGDSSSTPRPPHPPTEAFAPQHTPFPVPFDEPHRDDMSIASSTLHFPPPPFDHEGSPPPPPMHPGDQSPPPPWHPHEGPGHHMRPGHHRGPKHHRPHFFHRHGPHRHPFVFSIGSILFFVVVASLLFKYVRAKTGLFNNSKYRRERAAEREECRNRAAYRRAAMCHRLSQWWSRLRQPESTSDYEEKRSRILGQEGVLEDVMQSEIRDLRRAHEMVDELMRAEQSRQRLYHDANFGSPSSAPAELSYSPQRQNIDVSRPDETILPLYQPPPPSYDQELEGDLTVVDGFSYTPSATNSTPDSSVIDFSPRMSFDTSATVTKE